jgi:hypothetical protein
MTGLPGTEGELMSQHHYKPGGMVAKLAMGTIAFTAFGDVTISAIDGFGDGDALLEHPALGLPLGLFYLAVGIALLTAGVTFLMWIYRANKNLHALGSQASDTPGWAVGFWFIPFLNLYKPFRNAQEVWVLSGQGTTERDEDGYSVQPNASGAPQIITAWWTAWILSGITARAIDSGPGLLLSSALTVVAGVCVILMIRGVEERQAASWHALAKDFQWREGLAHTADETAADDAVAR